MNEDFVSFELAKKLKEKGFNIPFYFFYRTDDKKLHHLISTNPLVYSNKIDDEVVAAPTVEQIFKWFRKVKNIDIEIHSATGMLGIKAYIPYINTYTEFTLDSSPDVIRHRQKTINPQKPLPHEIIPAHIHFKEWEDAAIYVIEYAIDEYL